MHRSNWHLVGPGLSFDACCHQTCNLSLQNYHSLDDLFTFDHFIPHLGYNNAGLTPSNSYASPPYT